MPLDGTTSITIGGIQCWEEEPPGPEEFTRYRSQAMRRLRCAWADRMALAAVFFGGNVQNGVLINVNPPLRYPDATWMQVDAVTMHGEGVLGVGPHGMASYQWAVVDVHYATSDVELLEDDIGTLSVDVSSQVLMPSQSEPTFKWKGTSTDLPVEATPGIVVPIVDFVKARRNVPDLSAALATALSLVDHVNSSTFEGASAGKVLYFGPSSTSRITPSGLRNTDMVHRFQYHPYGHNKMLRPSTGAWQDIVTKAGDEPPHPEGNLNLLYQ